MPANIHPSIIWGSLTAFAVVVILLPFSDQMAWYFAIPLILSKFAVSYLVALGWGELLLKAAHKMRRYVVIMPEQLSLSMTALIGVTTMGFLHAALIAKVDGAGWLLTVIGMLSACNMPGRSLIVNRSTKIGAAVALAIAVLLCFPTSHSSSFGFYLAVADMLTAKEHVYSQLAWTVPHYDALLRQVYGTPMLQAALAALTSFFVAAPAVVEALAKIVPTLRHVWLVLLFFPFLPLVTTTNDGVFVAAWVLAWIANRENRAWAPMCAFFACTCHWSGLIGLVLAAVMYRPTAFVPTLLAAVAGFAPWLAWTQWPAFFSAFSPQLTEFRALASRPVPMWIFLTALLLANPWMSLGLHKAKREALLLIPVLLGFLLSGVSASPYDFGLWALLILSCRGMTIAEQQWPATLFRSSLGALILVAVFLCPWGFWAKGTSLLEKTFSLHPSIALNARNPDAEATVVWSQNASWFLKGRTPFRQPQLEYPKHTELDSFLRVHPDTQHRVLTEDAMTGNIIDQSSSFKLYDLN